MNLHSLVPISIAAETPSAGAKMHSRDEAHCSDGAGGDPSGYSSRCTPANLCGALQGGVSLNAPTLGRGPSGVCASTRIDGSNDADAASSPNHNGWSLTGADNVTDGTRPLGAVDPTIGRANDSSTVAPGSKLAVATVVADSDHRCPPRAACAWRDSHQEHCAPHVAAAGPLFIMNQPLWD